MPPSILTFFQRTNIICDLTFESSLRARISQLVPSIIPLHFADHAETCSTELIEEGVDEVSQDYDDQLNENVENGTAEVHSALIITGSSLTNSI